MVGALPEELVEYDWHFFMAFFCVSVITKSDDPPPATVHSQVYWRFAQELKINKPDNRIIVFMR